MENRTRRQSAGVNVRDKTNVASNIDASYNDLSNDYDEWKKLETLRAYIVPHRKTPDGSESVGYAGSSSSANVEQPAPVQTVKTVEPLDSQTITSIQNVLAMSYVGVPEEQGEGTNGGNQPSNYKPSDFIVEKKLGAGHFGEVYLVKNNVSASTLVVKRIRKVGANEPDVENEVKILSLLKEVCGAYILCYIDYVTDDNYYYILTEFLGDFMTLNDFIATQAYSFDDIKVIINNLIAGLKEIHAQNVAHRDIKPDNIMIKKDLQVEGQFDIKYIDFGLACHDETCDTDKITGSLVYLAPEILYPQNKVPGQTRFSLASLQVGDLWSLGLSIFELLMGAELIQYYYTLLRQITTEKRPGSLQYLGGKTVAQEIVRNIAKDPSSLPIDFMIKDKIPCDQLNYALSVLAPLLDKDPSKRMFPNLA
jgi:serine/threonine protein kinase